MEKKINLEKNKKVLIIGGIIEAVILIFALVVAILVLTWSPYDAKTYGSEAAKMNIRDHGPMIGYFQNNPTAFFCIICIPVFVCVAIDFVYFAVIASRKESSLSAEQRAAIKAKAEEEARAEVMKELFGEEKKEEAKPEVKEEPKAAEDKEEKAE